MKELTVAEKAERYDKALANARYYHSEMEGDVCCVLEECFSELRENESEDEKIRQALIALLKYSLEDGSAIAPGFNETKEQALAWLEKQGNKDKLIKELGEYKVKYTQEVLEKHINSMNNKDDERLRKTTIAFLKDFADKGYENAVECIDWLEKQGEQKHTEWSLVNL